MKERINFCVFVMLATTLLTSCNDKKSVVSVENFKKSSNLNQIETNSSSENQEDIQIEILKQQIWENLKKVPGSERDYTSTVKLRIANGNIIDSDCKFIFPKSSWSIASILVDDYKEVLKNTSTQIFTVFYRLMTDSNILANEVYISGLWRPWMGSHVHIEGRGIDIGYIKSSQGSGVDFKYTTSTTENTFAKSVRDNLTINFPTVNQYLSPWYICNPSNNCQINNRVTALEKTHLDHLHLTLSN